MESTKTTRITRMRPVSEVIKASLERVKAAWPKLLVLSVVLLGLSFVIGLAFGGALAGPLLGARKELTTLLLGSVLLSSAVFVLLMVVLGIIYSISMMLAVAEVKENHSFGLLISKSFKLFLPVFLTALIVFFLVYGGFVLLLIPGIVIAVLASFSVYEVVFGNGKYLQAIKHSATIVSQNFWELVKRVLVIIGIAIVLGISNGILSGVLGKNMVAQGALSLLWMAVQVVLSWFTIAYYYEIYLDARKITDLDKKKSITWMWIVAAIGWVIGIIVLSFTGKAVDELLKNPQRFEEQFETSTEMDTDAQFDAESTGEEMPIIDTEKLIELYGQDMTEEEKEAFRQMMQQTSQTGGETLAPDNETNETL